MRLIEIGHSISLAKTEASRRVAAKEAETSMLIDLLEYKQINPTPEINTRLRVYGIGSHSESNLTSSTIAPAGNIGIRYYATFSGSSPALLQMSLCRRKLRSSTPDISIDKSRWLSGLRRRRMSAFEDPSTTQRSKVSHARSAKSSLGIKPRSLGQASRISGITPAAIPLLSVYLRKRKTALAASFLVLDLRPVTPYSQELLLFVSRETKIHLPITHAL